MTVVIGMNVNRLVYVRMNFYDVLQCFSIGQRSPKIHRQKGNREIITCRVFF